MIEVINYTNQEVEQPFTTVIEKSYGEVCRYLKDLPETIEIYFGGQEIIIPETGVGGFAYSRAIMTLAVAEGFADKQKQRNELRGTVFHESFHLAQHFTNDDGFHSALHSAIYEGCATVFERDYAKVEPLHGDYSAHSEEELRGWLAQLETVGTDYFEKDGVWEEWVFYNHELRQRWIIYKAGTWLVDQIIKATGMSILDFQNKTAKEILALRPL